MAKGSNSGKGKAVVGSVVTPAGPYVPHRQYEASQANGATVGVQHRLNLTDWYNGVFCNISQGAKWTDADIATARDQEYPNRGGTFQTVMAYRSYYNTGRHGLGVDATKARLPKVAAYKTPAVATVLPAAAVVPAAAPAAKGRKAKPVVK